MTGLESSFVKMSVLERDDNFTFFIFSFISRIKKRWEIIFSFFFFSNFSIFFRFSSKMKIFIQFFNDNFYHSTLIKPVSTLMLFFFWSLNFVVVKWCCCCLGQKTFKRKSKEKPFFIFFIRSEKKSWMEKFSFVYICLVGIKKEEKSLLPSFSVEIIVLSLLLIFRLLSFLLFRTLQW